MQKNKLNLFLLSTFAVSYIWQVIIYFTGGVRSSWFPFLMWIPGLMAVVFLLKTGQKLRHIGWGIRRWWYLLPAVLAPMAAVATAVFILDIVNLGSWSNKIFAFHGVSVDIPRVPLILGNHTQTLEFFVLNLILSIFFQSVPGCMFTLGEELGWRGYAQEKFIRKYGLNRGLIILGVIWGYWHLPVILMGYNFPGHPVLGALLLMPLGTTFLGVFLGWLYLRSKSIWIPALSHAAINLSAIILFNGTDMHHNELFLQLIWIGLWGIVAGPCLISLNRSRPELFR
ncbi:CPBP family intramembrane metalloprotease [bacterium]|nr:CPBP family intramembrane metalloprotease [candidate division CSSED10-310 bacterium]